MKYTKHLVIHADIIVSAKDKKEAQEIFERTSVLPTPREEVSFEGEQIDEETDWKKL